MRKHTYSSMHLVQYTFLVPKRYYVTVLMTVNEPYEKGVYYAVREFRGALTRY